jgi:hypothetical protein
MINPGDAIDAIVDALQNIPELVASVGGVDNIIGYHPTFPDSMYFQQDLNDLKPGQLLVRYLTTFPGQVNQNLIWKHRFGIYQKPPNTSTASTSAQHYTCLIDLINGVPVNGDGNKMLNYAVVSGCDLMDVPTLSIYTDHTLKQDFFLTTFTFPEIGDQ